MIQRVVQSYGNFSERCLYVQPYAWHWWRLWRSFWQGLCPLSPTYRHNQTKVDTFEQYWTQSNKVVQWTGLRPSSCHCCWTYAPIIKKLNYWVFGDFNHRLSSTHLPASTSPVRAARNLLMAPLWREPRLATPRPRILPAPLPRDWAPLVSWMSPKVPVTRIRAHRERSLLILKKNTQ